MKTIESYFRLKLPRNVDNLVKISFDMFICSMKITHTDPNKSSSIRISRSWKPFFDIFDPLINFSRQLIGRFSIFAKYMETNDAILLSVQFKQFILFWNQW